MIESHNSSPTLASKLQSVMFYAAELELEVDRLRSKDQYLQHEARDHIKHLLQLCNQTAPAQESAGALSKIADSCRQFNELLRDLNDPPGYHPAFDQVVAIAMRPLAESIFRWQQRVSGAHDAILRLDLQPDHIIWFPARLRHILDNLISNSLRFRDADKGEIRVELSLRANPEGYELRLNDNGVGIPNQHAGSMTDLFYRAAPARAAGLGVGLPVVKLLVDQCCGSLTVASAEGEGTNVIIQLPRYDLDDYID